MSSVTNQSFERSLERFRARLSVDQKKEFEMASINEVKETIVKIQDRIGPEKKLRNLARLRGFLEGMKQVEEAVQPFLNTDRVVGFVWGPIKLALLMASTHLRTLEILINTYEDIGTFIEGIRQLDRLFQNYSGARQVLEGCFDDILRFHQVALEELTRPNWRKAADLLWPQIKKRFDPILKSLQNRKAILSEGKLGAAIEEIQDSRHATLNKFQDIETLLKTSFDEAKEIQQRQHSALLEILLMDKGSIFTKLDAPDYQGDHQTALAQRHDDTSGSWLLQDPKFRQWADGKVRDDAVLYVNGMPGSGKTTLASTVIDYFKSDKDTLGGNLAFFYFKHQPQKASHKPLGGMLRAIVTQLLNQDHALLGPLQQKCGPLSKSDVVQEPFLKELGRDCLILQQRCWIILDGLDECDEPRTCQADKLKALQVIEWLLRKVLPAGPTDYCPIRVLFCAQRDGYIDQKLAPYPSINLDTTNSHIHNVQQYVNLMTAEVKARFSLDRSMESWIAHKVATTAKGMFLYAKVVLNNLLSQDSVAELKDELSGEHFPEGLNAAYERVVVRILDRPPISRRKTAETILGWLVCSPRALRWREIQSRFCIDSEKEICNYENLRVDNGKVLCGSLVELNPCEYYKDLTSEAVISIVHETARSYLVQSGRFSLGVTHTKMALFCTQYLASNPFRVKELDSIEGSALAGYYGLLDYAVTSWKEHVRFVTSSDNTLDEETRNNVRQSARKLLETQTRETKSPDHAHETTLERSVADCSVSSLDQFLLKSNDRGFLREQITLIRGVIETMDQTTLPGKNAFFDLNGYGRFKCSRVGCFGFSEGFPNQKDRNRHTLEHEQPFKCSVNGCYAQTVGYSLQRDLDTHIKRLHCNQTNLDGLFPISKKRREDTIYTAAAEGNLDQVKFFQASGSPINEPESPNKASSPLMLAAKNGHATICQYLVQEGVDPFLDRLGISPIIHAIMREDIDLARLFLNSSSMPPSERISQHNIST
ncbi:hypothetical protein QBC43DRAFT_379444 [Cladorrhinum sp. PSN259]|nr:hypothetical protein QBC43DRAFT_379444 [Cladorrhinum sp. PSN259]